MFALWLSRAAHSKLCVCKHSWRRGIRLADSVQNVAELKLAISLPRVVLSAGVLLSIIRDAKPNNGGKFRTLELMVALIIYTLAVGSVHHPQPMTVKAFANCFRRNQDIGGPATGDDDGMYILDLDGFLELDDSFATDVVSRMVLPCATNVVVTGTLTDVAGPPLGLTCDGVGVTCEAEGKHDVVAGHSDRYQCRLVCRLPFAPLISCRGCCVL